MNKENTTPSYTTDLYQCCRLQTDILLVHAPAYYDFRDENSIYFPYLSTSGDVPITPLYEYYPMGFNTLRRYLRDNGYIVDILNLCSLLLKHPRIDLERLLAQVDSRVFGIDLHWMVHVQGSLAIATLLKKLHPEAKIVFGGISASFYANELIASASVDMVMRGYDTHVPMLHLMDEISSNCQFGKIANLLWKDERGKVHDNPLSHMPRSFSLGMDWSNIPSLVDGDLFPIAELLSAQTSGCVNHCVWCGGSRESFKRIYGTKHHVVRKEFSEIEYEFKTISNLQSLEKYHYYACSSYNETPKRMELLFDFISRSGLKSVSYEQYRLSDDTLLRKMAAAHPRTIVTLSPESHDINISRRAGRGNYTMEEMEDWIAKALDFGIHEIDVWFFIGMPGQDRKSVLDTVAYCEKLLKKFAGKKVIPLLCPMVPFLDPGSTIFHSPEKYGYKLFFHSLEEHRQGMMKSSFVNRINYETNWLSRADLIFLGYETVRRLFQIKGEVGLMPESVVKSSLAKIDDASEFLRVVDRIDNISDPVQRKKELRTIEKEIGIRNQAIFFSGVANQAFPVNRKIGGRWFDAIPWDEDILMRLESLTPPA